MSVTITGSPVTVAVVPLAMAKFPGAFVML